MALYVNGLQMSGDTLSDRPASAAYIGTIFTDGSNGDQSRWDGAAWQAMTGGGGISLNDVTQQQETQ